MRKKVLALMLALVMVVAMLPTVAFAADFADTKGHWAEAQIDRWAEAGVVEGTGTGFNPGGNMTRSEAAKTFANLLKLSTKDDLSAYTDVPTDEWKAEALAKAVAKGIIKGTSATTLSPDGTLTREQMFVMVGRALGIEPVETATKTFTDGAETSDWAEGYINALADMGVINGVGNNMLDPTADINRASAMTVLDNLIGGYANEDGQTVEIVPGKVTLVVADDVKVTGEADPTVPIVVAGDAKTVDLEGVTVTEDAAPVVQVQVSDVTVENAPVGAEVKADEGTTGVTANGIDVSADADKDVVIPETEPETETQTPPPPPPAPTDGVTAKDIDDIIDQGRQTVNADMKGTDGVPYAVIPEFTMGGTGVRDVTVIIYDSSVTVGKVYDNIVNTLVGALTENSSKVSTITGITGLDGESVTSEDKTLTLSSSTDEMAIVKFVKALVGSDVGRVTNLKELVKDSAHNYFVVAVADKDDGVPTTVQYKVSFVMQSLADVIAAEIPAISAKMTENGYANATWTNYTLTVNITNGENTELGTVYTDIKDSLCNAFNLVRPQLSSVKDKLQDGTATLDLNDPINADRDLVPFVQALKLKDSDGDTITDVGKLMAQGRSTKISVLKGYEFQIEVVAKDDQGTGATTGTQTYTIKFAE